MENQKDQATDEQKAKAFEKFKKSCKYATDERTEDGRRVARGDFKKGITIAGVTHKDFEMVEPVMEDLFAAEEEVPPSSGRTMAYNGALMMIQLRRVGTFKGPFTMDMIGKIDPKDYNVLRRAQEELDVLGEAE